MTDFPGARWWRCDFHNHTPASSDYRGNTAYSDRDWLLDYMRAGIDCVAITDHNCGDRIDALRGALAVLAAQQPADPAYRPLVLLPGVEITTSEGLHLLAIFDEAEPAGTINRVLIRIDCPKLGKNHDKQCGKNALDTIEAIRKEGGIVVAAHVDSNNGLYETQATSSASGVLCYKTRLKSRTLVQILPGIDAAQVVNECNPAIAGYLPALRERVAIVAGSDAHMPAEAGSASTWVKMSRPSLRALRMALVDHKGSVQRFDSTLPNPNRTPPLWLSGLSAGPLQLRQNPQQGQLNVEFNPWFNSIIGGRGTGKSSLVELLRIVLRRDGDLAGERSGPLAQIHDVFRNFALANDKDGRGALRSDTKIRVKLNKDGQAMAVAWDKRSGLTTIEEHTGSDWSPVPEQIDDDYVRNRFPVTVLSQKQIYALAEQRGYLLELLDRQPQVDKAQWQRRFDAMRQRFLGLRAQARQLAPDLSQRPALEAELRDTERKLKALELSHHASSLQAYQRARRQLSAQQNLLAQWQSDLESMRPVVEDSDLFRRIEFEGFDQATGDEAEFIGLVEQVESELRGHYEQIRTAVSQIEATLATTPARFAALRLQVAITQAQADYQALLERLKSQGVESPDQYAALVARRDELQKELKRLDAGLQEQAGYIQQAEQVLEELTQLRHEISESRKDFITEINQRAGNRIRLSLSRFGTPEIAETSFRELIKQPTAFAEDIYEVLEGGARRGVLHRLFSASVADFENELSALKKEILRMRQEPAKHEDLLGEKVNKRLRTHIETRLGELEIDELLTWFPDDGLDLMFTQSGKSRSVDGASAGQKSAAVLSLLLAFGGEPLIVDQPEDDLDNAMVMDLVVSQIRANKTHRQLIVVTHNPNVVVNGDAEWVIPMHFHKGQIDVDATGLGAVSELGTRKAICTIMEGGENALRMRYKKILENIA
ncbi:TrlF family AAA-like ATPase [Xanthomonas campestris]|uniref:TrlF family AAA-like ATPase n=1 Tax=Xanthomonas campestris TaxID=339 RepID=UPI002378F86E|nr:AAA family ATPase [Xanthomonas campestris]